MTGRQTEAHKSFSALPTSSSSLSHSYPEQQPPTLSQQPPSQQQPTQTHQQVRPLSSSHTIPRASLTALTRQDPPKTSKDVRLPVKAASPEKSIFTEKEERVLKAAWHCLKSPRRSISRSSASPRTSTPPRLPPTPGARSRRSWQAWLRLLLPRAMPPRAMVSDKFFVFRAAGWLPACFLAFFARSASFLVRVWHPNNSRPLRRHSRRHRCSQAQGQGQRQGRCGSQEARQEGCRCRCRRR